MAPSSLVGPMRCWLCSLSQRAVTGSVFGGMARIPHGTGNSLQPTGAVRRMTRPVRWEEMAPHELRRAARTDMGSVPNNVACDERVIRSEEHTSELQSLMRLSYAAFCFKKKN